MSIDDSVFAQHFIDISTVLAATPVEVAVGPPIALDLVPVTPVMFIVDTELDTNTRACKLTYHTEVLDRIILDLRGMVPLPG